MMIIGVPLVHLDVCHPHLPEDEWCDRHHLVEEDTEAAVSVILLHGD